MISCDGGGGGGGTTCEDCEKNPCECPCDVCDEFPCVCPCEDCGENPCVCEDDAAWNGVVFENGTWASILGAIKLAGVEDDVLAEGNVTLTNNILKSETDMIAVFFENPVDVSGFTKLNFQGSNHQFNAGWGMLGMFAWWYGGILYFENPDAEYFADHFEAQQFDAYGSIAQGATKATFVFSDFDVLEYDDEEIGSPDFSTLIGIMVKNCADDADGIGWLELTRIWFE